MTENSDPYENALAERMNRTIKEEFGLDRKLKSRQQVYELLQESISLYNQKRPHLALNMKTPEQVYRMKNPDYQRQSGSIKIRQLILGRYILFGNGFGDTGDQKVAMVKIDPLGAIFVQPL